MRNTLRFLATTLVAAMLICMGIKGGSFGWSAFLAGAVMEAIPGIIIQIVLIPILVMAIEKAGKGPETV